MTYDLTNNNINNNLEGTNMTDNNIITTVPGFASVVAAYPAVGDKFTELLDQITELKAQLDAAKQQRAFAVSELAQLKQNLQRDLADWAEQNLTAGDDDYAELSELMVNNDLEGLKRKFAVTVRVTYEFVVEVEATDEDAAQDEVDNDIYSYASDNWDGMTGDTEFEVSEI